jgi:hypothetical protein
VERELREALERVHEGGALLGVDVFRFHGDPSFVVAVRLWFRDYRITFLAGAEQDEVKAACGPVAIEDEGEWADASSQPGWSGCVGCDAQWAWAMTNQNGYTDAVRIEFEKLDGSETRIVEFVVAASAFRFFAARAV